MQLEALKRAIHEAAEKLRAMPDDELVSLALRASPSNTLPDDVPAEPRRVPRKPRQPPAVRKAMPKRKAQPTVGPSNRGSLKERVLACVGTEPIHANDVAKKIGHDPKIVATMLSSAFKKGILRRVAKGTYALAGRQAGAKPARAPKTKSGDDEEGGASVKLSAASPVPNVPDDVEDGVDLLRKWLPTPAAKPREENVVALVAPPVEASAVTAPTDRIRCTPYHATISVEACLKKQRAAADGPRRSCFAAGGGSAEDHCAKCRGCPIGQTVRERLCS